MTGHQSMSGHLSLYMRVVVNMVFAVAVIAVAAGAVAELQLWIGDIGSAADTALVDIVFCLGRGALLIGEGDRAGSLLGLFRPDGSVLASAGRPPGGRQQIQNIFTCKQQEIGDANKGEQVLREGDAAVKEAERHIQDPYKVDDGQGPGTDGKNKENHKLCVGIGGCVGQHQCKVQIKSHLDIKRVCV